LTGDTSQLIIKHVPSDGYAQGVHGRWHDSAGDKSQHVGDHPRIVFYIYNASSPISVICTENHGGVVEKVDLLVVEENKGNSFQNYHHSAKAAV